MNSESTTDSSGDEQYSRHFRKCFKKPKLTAFITRPNASGGYWLCGLLPLALGTAYFKSAATCQVSNLYADLLLAACGMCVQSLCFFIYAFFNLGLPLDLCISCLPTVLTAVLYKYFLLECWFSAICWSFLITYGYQRAYVHVMKVLPRCFSYGECAIMVQGLFLFLLNASQQMPAILAGQLISDKSDIFSQLRGIMLFALFCLYFISFIFYKGPKCLKTAAAFYAILCSLALMIVCAPITQPLPLFKVLQFILNDRVRVRLLH